MSPPRVAAAFLCAAALTLAAPTTALAVPLETPSETVTSDANEVAVSGTGSASQSAELLANPGSATSSANGATGSANGSGSAGSGSTGTGSSGTGSGKIGDRAATLGPRIASMLADLMARLGYAPGPQYATCDDVRNAGLAPLLRGAPSYSPHLDPDGDGIACA
ncbi:excalibur calcium-binding domain-containing protein [Nocardia sp. NPDC050406]|uniref:excalibur calcium-binding domain-containing protein n=1 Tax=Nocardia sp. NPDC050406 TaxID=3364318 RepID=UPI00379F29BC